MAEVFDFAGYLSSDFDEDLSRMAQYGKRSTGFENLSDKQNFFPGLYVLGGLPGMGKTTFALQMGFDLAVSGERVVYCSYEMSKVDLTARMLAREMKRHKISVTAAQIKTRRFEGYYAECLSKVRDEIGQAVGGNFFGLECSYTVEELIKKLKPEVKSAEDKPFVAIVDYLQLVGTSDKKATSARERIDSVLNQLKKFQLENGATIILLSSFNRESNKNSTLDTKLSSFKESGGIEYTADVLWGLQPEDATNRGIGDYENFMLEKPRRVELSCLKNRYGGLYKVKFDYYSANDYFECIKEETAEKKSKPRMTM